MTNFRPVARRGDPQTSWEAARSVEGITDTQTRVLSLLLEFGPMTDAALAVAYGKRWGMLISSSGLRTRRAELTDMGQVVDTGRRLPLESGRMAIVWRAVGDAPRDPGGLFDTPEDPEPGPSADPVYEDLP